MLDNRPRTTNIRLALLMISTANYRTYMTRSIRQRKRIAAGCRVHHDRVRKALAILDGIDQHVIKIVPVEL